MILLWGIRLCIMVRKAPSEFNESRFISMTIYNEFLLSIFLNVSMWVFHRLEIDIYIQFSMQLSINHYFAQIKFIVWFGEAALDGFKKCFTLKSASIFGNASFQKMYVLQLFGECDGQKCILLNQFHFISNLELINLVF